VGVRATATPRRAVPLGAEDWRDFRARLVSQQKGAGFEGDKGWAYQTDLLEQGSLLLSVPGDYWSIRRQYFCKVVMLVISHTEQFTAALVLNRPTALTLRDVNIEEGSGMFTEQATDAAATIQESILKLVGLAPEDDEWRVWFGGDCEGIEVTDGTSKLFCLHTLERLAGDSQCIIKGVFMIDFTLARQLVRQGLASKDDFMVVVGYTGWGRGQLQGELDRGGAWILGAADEGLLLGSEQGVERRPLCSRLLEACSSGRPGDEGLPDGVRHWSRLFKALRPSESEGLDAEEEAHNDEMVRRWVDLYLDPSKVSTQNKEEAGAAPGAAQVLPKGTLLRGSATEWVLGRPPGTWPTRAAPDAWQLPGQYLHKGVLLLLAECGPGQGARLVLLNGPSIGEVTDGRSVRFGGLEDCHSGSIISLPGGGPIAGRFSLPPGELHALLRRGALAVVDGGSPEDVWSASPPQMWAAAGGRLESLAETSAALQGDRQRRKWYRALLGLELGSGE